MSTSRGSKLGVLFLLPPLVIGSEEAGRAVEELAHFLAPESHVAAWADFEQTAREMHTPPESAESRGAERSEVEREQSPIDATENGDGYSAGSGFGTGHVPTHVEPSAAKKAEDEWMLSVPKSKSQHRGVHLVKECRDIALDVAKKTGPRDEERESSGEEHPFGERVKLGKGVMDCAHAISAHPEAR